MLRIGSLAGLGVPGCLGRNTALLTATEEVMERTNLLSYAAAVRCFNVISLYTPKMKNADAVLPWTGFPVPTHPALPWALRFPLLYHS